MVLVYLIIFALICFVPLPQEWPVAEPRAASGQWKVQLQDRERFAAKPRLPENDFFCCLVWVSQNGQPNTGITLKSFHCTMGYRRYYGEAALLHQEAVGMPLSSPSLATFFVYKNNQTWDSLAFSSDAWPSPSPAVWICCLEEKRQATWHWWRPLCLWWDTELGRSSWAL